MENMPINKANLRDCLIGQKKPYSAETYPEKSNHSQEEASSILRSLCFVYDPWPREKSGLTGALHHRKG